MAVIVLFVRHAEAQEAGHGVAGRDESRRLTRKGRRQARRVADALERARVRPDTILTSPLVRARETAAILSERIKRGPEPATTPALAPPGAWADLGSEVTRVLGKPGAAKSPGRTNAARVVAAVGHQPNLGQMVSEALGLGPRGIDLAKGACVALAWKSDTIDDAPTICLAMTPEVAERIR